MIRTIRGETLDLVDEAVIKGLVKRYGVSAQDLVHPACGPRVWSAIGDLFCQDLRTVRRTIRKGVTP